MKWIWICLFLLACAAPTEYQRGTAPAPMRPPSATPAGAGAPTVGQPGMRPDAIPRSPYRRILPEDEKTRRGPGWWNASATPLATNDPYDPIIILANAPLSPPAANFYELMRATQCVIGARDMIAWGAQSTYEEMQETIKQLKQDGRCVVARIYRMCIESVSDGDKGAAKRRAKEGKSVPPSLDRLVFLARHFANKECGNSLDDPEMSERAKRLLRLTLMRASAWRRKIVSEGAP